MAFRISFGLYPTGIYLGSMKTFILSFVIFVALTLIVNVALEILVVAFTGSRANTLLLQLLSALLSGSIIAFYLLRIKKQSGIIKVSEKEDEEEKEDDPKYETEAQWLARLNENQRQFVWIVFWSIVFIIFLVFLAYL